MHRIRVDADVVFAGVGTPVDDGSVVVQVAGPRRTVLFVGDRRTAAERYPDAGVVDAGTVVAPPPVNAHLHLDLSTMPTFRGAYVDFVRAVLQHGRAGMRGIDAARYGVDEVVGYGTTTVGDIVASEEVMHMLLADERLTGVAYWEVIGPDPADADDLFDATRGRVERFMRAQRPGGVRVGVSPHAPHTVSAPLMSRLIAWTEQRRLPVQVHVAESAEEARLHTHGDGPLRAFMGPLLADFRASGRSPIGYMAALGALRPHVTLVHATYVDDADVAAIQHAGCSVVHCPRSNERLGGDPLPWSTYARHGADVAIGTDSRGSSPDLNVLADIDAAAEVHGRAAPLRALVRAAVTGGHRALGTTRPRVARGAEAATLLAWQPRPGGRPVPLDHLVDPEPHV